MYIILKKLIIVGIKPDSTWPRKLFVHSGFYTVYNVNNTLFIVVQQIYFRARWIFVATTVTYSESDDTLPL